MDCGEGGKRTANFIEFQSPSAGAGVSRHISVVYIVCAKNCYSLDLLAAADERLKNVSSYRPSE